MKHITLNSKNNDGKLLIVDDDMFDYMSKTSWHIDKNGYAVAYQKGSYTKINGIVKVIRLKAHRVITNCPANMVVDHINGNKLDCRKENLRICTMAQNQMNKVKKATKPNSYKGVYFDKRRNHWYAMIGINRKMFRIGTFNSEIEAALSYDKRALELFGEFANLNFK